MTLFAGMSDLPMILKEIYMLYQSCIVYNVFMAVKITETHKPGTERKYLADMQSALKLKHHERRAYEARRSKYHSLPSALYGVVNSA
jgi:5'-3' exonuclease